ncbi:hypothetical protein [Okeania sp. KiyG1]|nr:hypothetical protein [Okeania sp. KiyG1]
MLLHIKWVLYHFDKCLLQIVEVRKKEVRKKEEGGNIEKKVKK